MLNTFVTAALIGAVSAGFTRFSDEPIIAYETKPVQEPVVEEETVVPAGPCDAYTSEQFSACYEIIILKELLNDTAITGSCDYIKSDFEKYEDCVSINTFIITVDDPDVTDPCFRQLVFEDFKSCVDLNMPSPAPENPLTGTCEDYQDLNKYFACLDVA